MNFGSNNGGQLINLEKNGILDLKKAAPKLRKCILAGGWDASIAGPSADLDLSAFLLEKNGRVTKIPEDVIYFKNMTSKGIELEADNLTGDGDGDDERINIDLDKIDSRIDKIIFSIVIFEAKDKRQTFGMINNSFVRLLDAENNEKEICRYSLKEEYGTDTAIVVCSLNRTSTGWEFEAIGDGCVADLNGLLTRYV